MRRSFDVKPVEEELTTVKVAGHKGNIPNTEYKIPPPPKANDDKPNMGELMKSEDHIPLRKTIVKDASPFERDTDKGAAAIVKREKAAGMLAHDIAKKYGFSLSFVNETLGSKKANDVKPV